MLKVSAFYLEKQRSFILKKIFFKPYHQDTSKRWCVLSQFSRRFWEKYPILLVTRFLPLKCHFGQLQYQTKSIRHFGFQFRFRSKIKIIVSVVHYFTSSHVFTTMISNSFYNCSGSGISYAKSFCCHTSEKGNQTRFKPETKIIFKEDILYKVSHNFITPR